MHLTERSTFILLVVLGTFTSMKSIVNAFFTTSQTSRLLVRHHRPVVLHSSQYKKHNAYSVRLSNGFQFATRIRMSSGSLDNDDNLKGDRGALYDSFDNEVGDGSLDNNGNKLELSPIKIIEDEGLVEGDNASNNNDDDDDVSEANPIIELSLRIQASLQKSKDATTKKRNSLQKEFEKAKNLENTMKRANLIISNLYQLPQGTERALVQDWDQDGMEIELIFNTDEYSSPQEEADALFATARKMKRGSKIVEDLLSKTEESLVILDDASIDLDAVMEDESKIDEGRLYIILERLERSSSSTGFVMKDDVVKTSKGSNNNRGRAKPAPARYQPSFRRFLSPNGCIVLVGKNRRDNEAICFQVARADDIWFHARGCPGAHVLLQIRRGSPRPTDDCMQFAANLAAFYSDARTERKAPVTTASPKHIQKPRGAPPGAVKLREELNTVTGYPADVAEELKVAREESGVIWDESGKRSLGEKAKNKKRTKDVLKQSISKKKAEKKEKKNNRKADQGSNFW